MLQKFATFEVAQAKQAEAQAKQAEAQAKHIAEMMLKVDQMATASQMACSGTTAQLAMAYKHVFREAVDAETLLQRSHVDIMHCDEVAVGAAIVALQAVCVASGHLAETSFVSRFVNALDAVIAAVCTAQGFEKPAVLTTQAKRYLETGVGKIAPDVSFCPSYITLDNIGSALVDDVAKGKPSAVSITDHDILGQSLQQVHALFRARPLRSSAWTFLFNAQSVSSVHAKRVTGPVVQSMLVGEVTPSHPLPWSDPKTVKLLVSMLLRKRPQDALPAVSMNTYCSEVIGLGASSVVYSATDPSIVVKVAHGQPQNTELDREAAVLSALTADGVPYIPTLTALLADGWPCHALVLSPRCQPVTTRRPFQKANCLQVLTALRKAHEAGYCHRDVRPENVMLHESNVILLDWGFSCALGTVCAVQGSVRCAAPRVRDAWFKKEDFMYTAADDVYSAALTCLLLLNPPVLERLAMDVGKSENCAESALNAFWASIASLNAEVVGLTDLLNTLLGKAKLEKRDYEAVSAALNTVGSLSVTKVWTRTHASFHPSAVPVLSCVRCCRCFAG